jgi:hypothetical protein
MHEMMNLQMMSQDMDMMMRMQTLSSLSFL